MSRTHTTLAVLANAIWNANGLNVMADSDSTRWSTDDIINYLLIIRDDWVPVTQAGLSDDQIREVLRPTIGGHLLCIRRGKMTMQQAS